jgi:hypothetical protein
MKFVVAVIIALIAQPAAADIWSCSYGGFGTSHSTVNVSYRVTQTSFEQVGAAIGYRLLENNDLSVVAVWSSSYAPPDSSIQMGAAVIVIGKKDGQLLIGNVFLNDPTEGKSAHGTCHRDI